MLQVPDDILHNKALNDAIAILPANYNFEVRSPALTVSDSYMCLLPVPRRCTLEAQDGGTVPPTGKIETGSWSRLAQKDTKNLCCSDLETGSQVACQRELLMVSPWGM